MKALTTTQLQNLCDVAREVAVSAGQFIQSQFDQEYKKEHKEGGDSLASQVVTAVDFKAQEIILEGLGESIETYDLGLLTEESADDHSRADKAYFWCIDPMDGTLPFTEHRSGYAVSIALMSQSGDPVVGVAYIPDLEACYTAIKGSGVYLNDQPFVRKKPEDPTIHFYMDQSFLAETYLDTIKQQFEARYTRVSYHSDFGGVRNAIGVMSSAKGCYFKLPRERKGCGSIWDYAATRLFMEELGLCVSTFEGDTLHLNRPNTTFMNETGILYATDEELATFIRGLRV